MVLDTGLFVCAAAVDTEDMRRMQTPDYRYQSDGALHSKTECFLSNPQLPKDVFFYRDFK